MPSPTESAVMAFFFATRSARKHGPPSAGQQRLNEAMIARARREEAQRQLEEQAERSAIERSWG